MNLKERVGIELVKTIQDGETIGAGTGTTVTAALDALSKRVKEEGLSVKVVPTSYQTAWRCAEIGLEVLSPLSVEMLSWSFDGADEVDPQLRLIKGRGGAMLQEKLIAAKSKRFVIAIDETKLVKRLGEKQPIPVEVVPGAVGLVTRQLKKLAATEVLVREAVAKNGPVITEAGNVILDARFSKIEDTLEQEIRSIIGVVESGLFIGYASEVLVGKADGSVERKKLG